MPRVSPRARRLARANAAGLGEATRQGESPRLASQYLMTEIPNTQSVNLILNQ